MISVLVPVYNSSKYLAKCLRSILNQTYRDFELVIVNDGSKDNSGEIIESFASKDKRVVSLYKENQKSISKTRNFLLDHIKGDYFIFIDSDDIVDKRFLEYLFKEMVRSGSDIVACGFKINKRKLINRKIKLLSTLDNKKALQEMMFGGKFYAVWNKLIKTDLLKDNRFNESLNYGEDLLFFFDLLKNDITFTFIKNKLYYYRIRPGSLSTSKFGDSKKMFLETLIKMIDIDKYNDIKEILKVWVYCTARYFRYMTRHQKKEHKEYRLYLKDIINEYKEYYKNSKIVNKTYKMVVAYFSLF